MHYKLDRLRLRNVSRAIAACSFLLLPAVQAYQPDPISWVLGDLTFVGTTTYSPENGLGKHGYKPMPMPAIEHRVAGSAYIFETPRNTTRIKHKDLIERLRDRGVSATLSGDLVYATVGGPFYTVRFSYEGHSGIIFNAPNPAITSDETLDSKWYDEDLAVVYDR
jgi:hypothetical protein